MVNSNRKQCALKFRSRGDLLSALETARRENISVERFGKDLDYLIAVPVDRVNTFLSLGSIHFGIEVRA